MGNPALKFVSVYGDDADATHLTPAGHKTAVGALPPPPCKTCGESECRAEYLVDRFVKQNLRAAKDPSEENTTLLCLDEKAMVLGLYGCEDQRTRKLYRAAVQP